MERKSLDKQKAGREVTTASDFESYSNKSTNLQLSLAPEATTVPRDEQDYDNLVVVRIRIVKPAEN